jgi:hypothetical protein
MSKVSATNRFEKLLSKLAAQKDAVQAGGQSGGKKGSTVASPRFKVGPAFGQRGEDAKSAPKRRRAKSPSAQGSAGRFALESGALSSQADVFESVHSMLPQDIRDLLSSARARRQQRAAIADAAASLEESKAAPLRASVVDGEVASCKFIPQEMPLPSPSPSAFFIDLPKPFNPHTARPQANGIDVELAPKSPILPPPLQPAVGAQGSANGRRRPTSGAKSACGSESDGGRSGGGRGDGASEGRSSAAAASSIDWLDKMQRRRKGGKKSRDVGDAALPTYANRRAVVGGVLHSAAEHFLG